MDILYREMEVRHSLASKDRNTLYCTDIIYRTTMFKIGQGNPSCFLIHSHRRDRRRNLLDQCQMLFPVFSLVRLISSSRREPEVLWNSRLPSGHPLLLKADFLSHHHRTKILGSGAVNIFPQIIKGGWTFRHFKDSRCSS